MGSEMCIRDSSSALTKEKFFDRFFDEYLFSFDALSIFTIAVYLVGLCITVPGLVGIIWYEKYGNHRAR